MFVYGMCVLAGVQSTPVVAILFNPNMYLHWCILSCACYGWNLDTVVVE